jgi:cytochrome c-type biogenesis protein
MITQNISYHAAFLAGILSFFSPCILPLIPAYFTLITGFSLDELTQSDSTNIRKKVILSTVAYILGFSTIFIILGASATFVGQMIQDYQTAIRVIGGHIICILGFHLTGIIHISGLDFEKRVHFHQKPLHFMGTFIIGMAFGAGWSPCIGPILGSIFILAANQNSIGQGIILLTLYSAGLAIPFLLISFSIQSLLTLLARAKRLILYVNAISGLLLIIIGVLLITNKLQILG